MRRGLLENGSEHIGKWYSQYIGIIQAVWQQMITTGESDPTLSNKGVISSLQFGKFIADDAYIVTPRIYAPGFLLGVSTYNKTLTLEVSYCEPAHRREEVESFMDLMERELRSLQICVPDNTDYVWPK